MSGESDQQKKAGKAAKNAVSTLLGSKETYLKSPEYLGLQTLVKELLNNPYTYSPEDINRIETEGAARAQSGAKGMLKNTYQKASVAGGGYRSGATRGGEFEVASRLGEGLASAYRQSRMTAAQQRPIDIMNALNAGHSFTAQRSSYDDKISNAYMGQGQTLTTLAGQPTPFQQAMSGVGSVVGTGLAASGAAASGGGTLLGGMGLK